MQISFAFQATTLHLSSLALWEYLQLKASLGLGSDVARAEKGWDSALWLIDHIQQSGRNQSMAETAAAVRAMQKAPRVLKAEAASPPFPSASEVSQFTSME